MLILEGLTADLGTLGALARSICPELRTAAVDARTLLLLPSGGKLGFSQDARHHQALDVTARIARHLPGVSVIAATLWTETGHGQSVEGNVQASLITPLGEGSRALSFLLEPDMQEDDPPEPGFSFADLANGWRVSWICGDRSPVSDAISVHWIPGAGG